MFHIFDHRDNKPVPMSRFLVHAVHDPDGSCYDDDGDEAGREHFSDLPFSFSFCYVHEHEQLDCRLQEGKDKDDGHDGSAGKVSVKSPPDSKERQSY